MSQLTASRIIWYLYLLGLVIAAIYGLAASSSDIGNVLGGPLLPWFTKTAGMPYSLPLLPAIFWSALRVILGSGLGVMLGVALGLAAYSQRDFRGYYQITFACLAAISPLVWIRLVFSWFGIGNVTCITTTAIGSVAIVAVATLITLRRLPIEYVYLCRSLQLTTAQQTANVLVPFLWPTVITYGRICLLLGWGNSLYCEGLGIEHGLGKIILTGHQTHSNATITIGATLVVATAILVDQSIALAARFVFQYGEASDE